MKVKTGLEVLRDEPQIGKHWGRCGLLANQASLTADFVPAWQVCREIFADKLTTLFGPQHGFYGTVQDNMIETPNSRFRDWNVPIYSLYSQVREPSANMLKDLDTLIIDLQMTGTRIYTFKSSIYLCLKACVAAKKRVVILDRPNPIGGEVLEGRILAREKFSFVGYYPMPMRHGLTMAEVSTLFNRAIGAELDVVKLQGWDPSSYYQQLERPWIITSPNMPGVDTALVYPGTVMLEGTNLSEGRGTALPFQFVGAPYLPSGEELIQCMSKYMDLDPRASGVYLRPCEFMPTSQKWQGQACKGLQIHVVTPAKVRSFNLTLALMRAAIEIGDGQFAFKPPPYEYEYDDLPMKFIFGDERIQEKLMAKDFSLSDPYWHEGLGDYIKDVRPALLYPRELRT